MKRISLAVAVLFTAAFGLAACTQAPSDGMSGAAVDGGSTEVVPAVDPAVDPAVEPTVESLPMTEEAAPPAGADGGTPLQVPAGVVAADDPKAAARAGAEAAPGAGSDSNSSSDAAGGDSPDALSPGDGTAYVNAHNRWRGNYGTSPVVWDATIAAYAQDWANQQAAVDGFDHRQNNQYGENLWKGTSGFYGPNDVVDGWGDEVQDWDLSCTGDLEQCCKTDWWKCGHFTQVVWSTTTKIGCGKATTASGSDIVVCNYSPAGNMQGVAPIPPQTLLATPTPTRTPAPQSTPAPTATTAAGGTSQPKVIGLAVDFNLPIPDNGAPVTGVMNVITEGTIAEVGKVNVNVTHPYIGDLSVKLVHPDGTEAVLHNQTGGSAQNLIRTYGREGIPIADLAKFIGKKMKGQWKLVVQDHAAEDVGTLNSGALYRTYTTP